MSGESSSKRRDEEEKEEEEPPLASYNKKLKFKLKPKGNEVAADEFDNCYDETSTIISSSPNGFVPKEIHICYICSKSFHSIKSLHGHMRSHPNRNYRGMIPPKKSCRPIIRTYSDDESDSAGYVSNEEKALPYRPAAASSSSVNGDEDELMLGAVYGLMLIATGEERYKTLPRSKKDGIRVYEVSPKKPRFDDQRWVRKMENDCYSSIPRSEKDGIRISEVSPPSNKQQQHQVYIPSKTEYKEPRYRRPSPEQMERMLSYNKPRFDDQSSLRKNRKMENDKKSSYKCSICDKCFGTHQALGGHTSSTHPSKIVVIKCENGGASSNPSPIHHRVESSKAVGECRICKLKFSSGRALGGHMRVHCIKLPVDDGVANADIVAAVVEDEAVVKCFDLNELPAD